MTSFRKINNTIPFTNIRRCRIDHIKTVEFPNKSFPLVSLEDGSVSVSINSYFMYLFNSLGSPSQQSSFNHAITAICDLYDFYIAKYNGCNLSSNEFRGFLVDFGNSKVNGTILGDGTDPTELYWQGIKRSTMSIYAQWINDYIDFLNRSYHRISLNPLETRLISSFERFSRETSGSEERKGLLQHLIVKQGNGTIEKRDINISGRITSEDRLKNKINRVFPIDRSIELVENTRSIRNKMILLLTLFGGGLRGSELTHIMRGDITWDTKISNCIVTLDHPSSGRMPKNPKMTRKQFIELNHSNSDLHDEHLLKNLKPRNEYSNLTGIRDKLYSGWKGMSFKNSPRGYRYDHMAHWLELEASVYFWKLYLAYTREYLEFGGTRFSANSTLHPWLFVSDDNKGKNSTLPLGYPMTIKAIDGVFESACKRIGLDNPGKHSARHAYAFYAINVKTIDAPTLSQMLRHSRISSVEDYYQLDPLKIKSYLSNTEPPTSKEIEFPSHWYDNSEVSIG